jgi:hypothetical protein
MLSKIQHLANKQNSLKSTGPGDTTHTRHNAISHGLTSTAILIKGESKEAYEELADRVILELSPQGVVEEELISQITYCLWRLRRVPVAEKAIADDITGLSNNVHIIKWPQIFKNSNSFDSIQKYEVRIRNQLFKLMSAFSTLSAMRGAP